MATALMDLLLATFSEENLIAKTAHDIVEKGWHYERPYIGDIKDIIRRTRPSHGQLKSRLAAVRREMKRQYALRKKRRDYREASNDSLIGLSGLERKEYITRLARYILDDEVRVCHDFLRRGDYRLLLVECETHDYWNRFHLYVIGPDRVQRKYKTRSAYNGNGIMNIVWGATEDLAKGAMRDGASISVDFTRLATVATYPDGTVKEFPWTDYDHFTLVEDSD